MRAPGRRTRRIVLVVIVLLIINVPFLLHQWQFHRLDSQGVDVTATVTSSAVSDDVVALGFTLPASVDPDQPTRYATVDLAEGETAKRTGEVDVRVLPGHPAVFELDGQHKSHGPTYLTLIADLALLLLVLVSWRFGARLRRPPLEAVALGDVEPGEEGSLLDKHEDGSYLINGVIGEADSDSLVLVLRDRDVTVHLRDHSNPLAVGDRAKVHAHLVG